MRRKKMCLLQSQIENRHKKQKNQFTSINFLYRYICLSQRKIQGIDINMHRPDMVTTENPSWRNLKLFNSMDGDTSNLDGVKKGDSGND
jgi:hypothetical protein